MEVPAHSHVHEEGPEGEQHEKKSVLKKVKEKAKKIKDTIGKKKHEHGEEHNRDDDDKEVERYSEEEEKEEDAEVHGAPMYESEAVRGFVENREKAPTETDVKLRGAAVNLEEDAAAPRAGNEAPPEPGSYQTTALSSAGGPEPGLIRSFQAMSTEGPKKEEEEKTSPLPSAVHAHGGETQTIPEGETKPQQPQSEMSYKEKVTSTLVDKAAHAKEAAVMAAAGTAEYGKKIAETVYEKITPQTKQEEARKIEEERGQPVVEGTKPTDKWGSMKDYLAEKLSPGEEDRALCEVISESIQKRKEEEGDIREETEEKPPTPAEQAGEKKSRKGVVGKIKGAVVSVFGGPHSSTAKPTEDEHERTPRLQESTN